MPAPVSLTHSLLLQRRFSSVTLPSAHKTTSTKNLSCKQHTGAEADHDPPPTQMIEGFHAMEQRRPPEYIIEVFADPSSVKDVVRGMFVTARLPPSLTSFLLSLVRSKMLINIFSPRHPPHNLLPPLLPLHPAQNPRYTRPHAACR